MAKAVAVGLVGYGVLVVAVVASVLNQLEMEILSRLG